MTALGRRFKKTKTPEAARALLESELGPGADADAARAWLDGHGIEFSDDGDSLHFALDGPRRSLMVSVRWIVAIRIDEQGKVSAVEVEEALLGP